MSGLGDQGGSYYAQRMQQANQVPRERTPTEAFGAWMLSVEGKANAAQKRADDNAVTLDGIDKACRGMDERMNTFKVALEVLREYIHDRCSGTARASGERADELQRHGADMMAKLDYLNGQLRGQAEKLHAVSLQVKPLGLREHYGIGGVYDRLNKLESDVKRLGECVYDKPNATPNATPPRDTRTIYNIDTIYGLVEMKVPYTVTLSVAIECLAKAYK